MSNIEACVRSFLDNDLVAMKFTAGIPRRGPGICQGKRQRARRVFGRARLNWRGQISYGGHRPLSAMALAILKLPVKFDDNANGHEF